MRKHGKAATYRAGCRCGECSVAVRKANAQHRTRHRDAVMNASRKRDQLRLYGLTDIQLADIIARQKGGCGICGRPLEPGKRTHIDHCHKANRVRGVLCSACNSGIGKLGDSIAGLRRALAYLEAFEAA